MKRLLIVIDSLSRNNGAHVATRAMIAALLKHDVRIDLLLASRTNDVEGLDGAVQYELLEPKSGFLWFVQGAYRKLKLFPVPRWVLDPFGRARSLMRRYNTILVVGENSHFRYLVTGVKGPRKVVFIHTDYVNWKSSCDWAVEDSRFDRKIYRGFDVIAVIGQANADRFASYYPEFRGKVCAFHNLFEVKPHTIRHGYENLSSTPKIVTLSRLELAPQKKIDRIVRVAGELKRRGCTFDWTIYGRGSPSDEAKLKKLAQDENVLGLLHFAGFTSDVQTALAQADLHVLLSAYEGAPNVIIEAQTLGVPCISTDVGAVREMIDDDKTGMIVPQEESEIIDRMEGVLKHPEMVERWRENLIAYQYDNDKVLREYRMILNVGEGKV